jgi:hypothetical protein
MFVNLILRLAEASYDSCPAKLGLLSLDRLSDFDAQGLKRSLE